MQTLIGTWIVVILAVLAGVFGLQQYGTDWLKDFNSLETIGGVSVVSLIFLRGLLRIMRHHMVVYRESVAARKLAKAFRPGMSLKGMETALVELASGKLRPSPRSLLGRQLELDVQGMVNEKKTGSRAVFNRDEFVGFYRHSLGEGRRALEESRTLLMSLCVVATLAGLVLAMRAGKAGTAEEMQATTLQTFAFMRAAMAVSVTGLFGAALLYLIGAKTRVWEGRVVATVRQAAVLGLSPCLNMAAYPAVMMQEETSASAAEAEEGEREAEMFPPLPTPGRGRLNGAGNGLHLQGATP